MDGAKQFRLLDGKPLLIRTLEVFQFHPSVKFIAVATPADAVETTEEALAREGLTKVRMVVQGGATRQASVYNALTALPGQIDTVLVHDAVRPFVSSEHISQVIDAIDLHGAAALAVPVADTLRAGREGIFGETHPRDEMFRMQTPQGNVGKTGLWLRTKTQYNTELKPLTT